MFFDKCYIEIICSPGILANERHDTAVEEAMSWINEQGLRYEFEDRAAILQFDGGLSREDADKQALEEILERLKRSG